MTSTPTSPSSPTEQRLRDALQAAAPVDTRTEAGLDDLRARLDGGTLHALPPESRWTARRKALAVAAVLLVIAGVAGVVLAARGGDDDDRVLTTPDTATGWYVPKSLPAEWKLQAVTADFQDADGAQCPCRKRTWVSGDGKTAVHLLESQVAVGSPDMFANVQDAQDVDLGSGITATAGTGLFGSGAVPRMDAFVSWQRDGTVSVVYGNGLARDQVVDAARGVARTGGSLDPPLDGYELIDHAEAPTGLRSFEAVHVVLRNSSTGAVIGYVLVPTGYDPIDTTVVPEQVDADGATGPLLRVTSSYPGQESPAVAYLGRWPGADLYVDADAAFGADPGPATDDDVLAVLRSLRPASAEEWTRFVRTASTPAKEAKVVAPRLIDLAVPLDTPDAGGSTTTSSSAVPTTTAASSAVGRSGELKASDLQLRSVVSVLGCDLSSDPSGGRSPDAKGLYCYELGPAGVDGRDLYQAEATQQQGWVVTVKARPTAVGRVNALFNGCFDAAPSCPANSESGKGAVAVELDGAVISAPEVNAVDLADQKFTLSPSDPWTEAEAKALAAAINAG